MLLYHSEKTHAPLEPIPPEHGKICIAQNTKIHKILLSCNLVIHVKARVLKAKASNPRPGSRLSPDIDKAKTKTNTSNPRSRPRPILQIQGQSQGQDQGLKLKAKVKAKAGHWTSPGPRTNVFGFLL